MNKPREKITAICPKCRRSYLYNPVDNYRVVKWAGNCTPRIICPTCKHVMDVGKISAQSVTGLRHRQTTMFGMCKSRGLSIEQKQKYDLDIEIMARKFQREERRLYQ